MGYALADMERGSGATDAPGVRSHRGSDDGGFTPTVSWIGRIADARGGYRDLRQPLRIDVSQDPDDLNFVAFCPFANCGGVGATPDDALNDLGHEILGLRDELEATADDQLADDAVELKQRLRRALPQ